METLANLTSFVRTAETGSFSAAARRLGLTAAAVSRNVAVLERNLGLRLFHRSTRKLALTERGARFLQEIDGTLTALQAAIASAGAAQDEPSGTLHVSVSPIFGMRWIPSATSGIPAASPEDSRRVAFREPASRSPE